MQNKSLLFNHLLIEIVIEFPDCPSDEKCIRLDKCLRIHNTTMEDGANLMDNRQCAIDTRRIDSDKRHYICCRNQVTFYQRPVDKLRLFIEWHMAQRRGQMNILGWPCLSTRIADYRPWPTTVVAPWLTNATSSPLHTVWSRIKWWTQIWCSGECGWASMILPPIRIATLQETALPPL